MEPKQYLLSLLESAKRDDLECAQMAFKNLTPEEMQEEYGQSGIIKQQILDFYIEERKNWQKAKDFLMGLLSAAPKGNPGMPKGYSFRLEACPDCGRLIKENWIIRHRKSGCRLG